jgi:hypothetical protein
MLSCRGKRLYMKNAIFEKALRSFETSCRRPRPLFCSFAFLRGTSAKKNVLDKERELWLLSQREDQITRPKCCTPLLCYWLENISRMPCDYMLYLAFSVVKMRWEIEKTSKSRRIQVKYRTNKAREEIDHAVNLQGAIIYHRWYSSKEERRRERCPKSNMLILLGSK